MEEYYKMSHEEVLNELNTNREGLTTKEVNERTNKYGYNELPQKEKTSILKIFWVIFLMLFNP